MSEMTQQRISEFLRLIFVRLWQEPNGLPASEVLSHISQASRLTEYEEEFLPDSHTRRYERYVRLATIPFVKAGWMVKNKSRWFITDDGKRACKKFPTALAFSEEAGRILSAWRESRSALALVTDEAEEKAWDQVKAYLQELRPYEFQVIVGDLLKALGYHLTWVAPPEKERGFVNFIAHTDPLGLNLPRIKVHVLHTGQQVMFEGLKAFTSVLGTDDAGIFVSSGGFTNSVIEAALEQRLYRLTLLDLENFFDLWLENYDKLTQEAQLRFPLKPVYFLSPSP
jgi:restriction system protein